MMQQQFTCQLLHWHQTNNKRILPWKGEQDAYKIWLSEIIMQQTRAAQGLAYYNAFVQKYPTIAMLANAADDEVYKLWEGLGYYTRCKNLLLTARFITNNFDGEFPNTYEGILALKGVGPYTAAAIGSFAYNLPHAVIDGNVFRVLARIFNISIATDSAEGKKVFAQLANELLDAQQPALYNQAIMDFGATICKPANPLCSQCPQQNICEAYRLNKVHQLPVKEKAIKKKLRWFSYFIFTVNGATLVHQRAAKDIWQSLHEFYLLETDSQPQWNAESINLYLANEFDIHAAGIRYISPFLLQQLTHQTVKAQFIKIALREIPVKLKAFTWYNQAQIEQLAFPRIINAYMQQESFPALLF